MANPEAILGEEIGPAFVTQPVPLKGNAGALALLLVGLGAIVIGALFFLDAEPGPATYVIAVGVAVALAGGVLLRRRVRGRCTVALHERGLVVTRGGRPQLVAYERVTGTFARERDILFNGVRAGKHRHVRIEIGPQTVEVGHFTPLGDEGEEDAFGEYFGAILLGRVDAAEAGLKAGKAITGKGWTLSHAGLRLPGGVQLPLSQLGAAYVYDDRMSVWRRGEESPALAVAEASRDAYTLLWLVRRALEEADEDNTVPGLGRALFARRPNKTLGIGALVFALFFLIPGVFLIVDGLVDDPTSLAAGLGWSAMGLPLVLAGVLGLRVRVTFHERGIEKRGLFGRRLVSFEDLTGLVYEETIRYYNGAYAGTTVRARFIPEQGKPIALSLTIQGTDADLESIRDAATVMIAARMANELDRKGSVAWTDATITREGVSGFAPKMIGRGERRMLPFDDTLLYRLDAGVLELFTGGEPKAALELKAAGLNFFPGFHLFMSLAAGPGEGEPED